MGMMDGNKQQIYPGGRSNQPFSNWVSGQAIGLTAARTGINIITMQLHPAMGI